MSALVPLPANDRPPSARPVRRVRPEAMLIRGLPPDQPVRYYVEPFLSWCAFSRNMTPNTIAAYRNALRPFAEFCEGPARAPRPGDVKPRVVQGYIAWRQAKARNGPATVNQHRSALSSFFDFLQLYEVVVANPVKVVKGLREPICEPRYYDVPQQERLIEGARQRAAQGMREWRDFALICLGLLCGPRIGEVCNLELGDLKLESGSLLVRQGKGRKDRTVLMPPWLSNVLRTYINDVRPHFRGADASPYLFMGRSGQKLNPRCGWDIVKRVTALIMGDGGLNPHGLRHSYTSRLVENDANMVAVSRSLGHASLQTTGRYAHLPTTRLQAKMTRWLGGKYAESEVPALPATPGAPIDGEQINPRRGRSAIPPPRTVEDATERARRRALRRSRKAS